MMDKKKLEEARKKYNQEIYLNNTYYSCLL